MVYISNRQEERFKELLLQAKLKYKDKERQSLFYVLSGNDDLYKQVDKIYDFEKQQLNCINENGEVDLEDIFVSSSSNALLKLGLELYNQSTAISVNQLFRNLDDNNAKLAINAIKIRYSIY